MLTSLVSLICGVGITSSACGSVSTLAEGPTQLQTLADHFPTPPSFSSNGPTTALTVSSQRPSGLRGTWVFTSRLLVWIYVLWLGTYYFGDYAFCFHQEHSRTNQTMYQGSN